MEGRREGWVAGFVVGGSDSGRDGGGMVEGML
jgi:hypothetical protein